MTRLHPIPGEGDDRDRIVATLRRELLAPLPDDVAAAHLEAMLLERDFDRASGPTAEPDGRRVDRPRRRARTLVGAGALAAALSLTTGFAAAGALPATAQQWISRATRVIGIPLPDASPSRPAPRPAPRSPARQPSHPPTPTVGEREARPTPIPTIAVNRPARDGPAVAKARAAKLPPAHGPGHTNDKGNDLGETRSDAEKPSDAEGGQTAPKAAPKAEKADEKVAPEVSKKTDKKSGSAADDNQGELGNAAASG
jgi:hypothetical protein